MSKNTAIVLGVLVLVLIGIFAFSNQNIIPNQNETMTELTLTSSAFDDGATIPSQYTCDGENLSPPLSISGVPEGTQSLVLLMDDPDIPQEVKSVHGIEVFDHWTLFNISPDTTEIAENSAPGTEGVNGAGDTGYTGPCPPPQYEPTEHRYFFRLLALDTELSLSEGVTKAELEQAAEGHVLAETQLMGRYERQ